RETPADLGRELTEDVALRRHADPHDTRAFGRRERAQTAQLHLTRAHVETAQRLGDRVDVRPVAEELQRHMPLLACRQPRVRSVDADRVEHIVRRTYGDERARHASHKQISLPSGSCMTIQLRPNSLNFSTRVAPNATHRAASPSMSSPTIRSRCT